MTNNNNNNNNKPRKVTKKGKANEQAFFNPIHPSPAIK